LPDTRGQTETEGAAKVFGSTMTAQTSHVP
jgi:hypothetical protein